jgi:hypothetical protein
VFWLDFCAKKGMCIHPLDHATHDEHNTWNLHLKVSDIQTVLTLDNTYNLHLERLFL